MKAIHPLECPNPVGPYSIATFKNDTLFSSGIIGLDANTGELKKTFDEQVSTIFQHIQNILNAVDMGFTNIMTVSVYLKDMNNFEKFNDVYSHYFQEPYPARVTLEVSRLPKNASIEISFVAMN